MYVLSKMKKTTTKNTHTKHTHWNEVRYVGERFCYKDSKQICRDVKNLL